LHESRGVPVFGGDLNLHLIIHKVSLYTWHVARTADSKDGKLVRQLQSIEEGKASDGMLCSLQYCIY
jgi:hypothetical protein